MNDPFIEENGVKIIKSSKVFYNPAQKFNRDLTILVINEFIKEKKNPKIFEAMSATGLRGIRFVKEIENECEIYLNDMDNDAIASIKNNLELNNIQQNHCNDSKNMKDTIETLEQYIMSEDSLGDLNTLANTQNNNEKLNGSTPSCNFKNEIKQHKDQNELNDHLKTSTNNNAYQYKNKKIFLSRSNCNTFLYQNRNKFDVIDIDPFGCCTTFIDSALANIKDNGLLCLTSTDTGVLCTHKKKCFLKYNSIITRTPAHHEQALRILLAYVCKAAGKYDKSIEPLLCVSVDFYVRIFIRIKKGKVKSNFENISNYLFCSCLNTIEIPILKENKNSKIYENKCDNCNNNLNLCGPFYNKNIRNYDFVKKLIDQTKDKRILGFLNLINDELDSFLFYSIPDISHNLKCSCIPSIKLVSALFNMNYNVSLTHCKLSSIKTNAKIKIVYDLIKRYFIDKEDEIFCLNDKATDLLSKNYNKKTLVSKLGPLSLPK